jgi:dTDP-4-amino-4,6-dideoxygalactose transaminase
VALGLNGKLQEINAAIGLRQLENFDELLGSRQSLVRRYRGALPETIVFPHNIERSSVCFASMLLPDRGTRDAAQARLITAGVEARTYYAPPVHQQPLFASAGLPLPRTEEVADRVLSVPLHARMAEDDVRLVLDTLNEETHSW